MTETRRFRCRPEAVPAARRFVRDVLRDQEPELTQAAELMISELATNCVRHARTDFELAIDVELAIDARGGIRVEVRDTGSGRPVVLRPPPRQLSGRGMQIVAAMSDAWGIIPDPAGKTVWFTLRRAAA